MFDQYLAPDSVKMFESMRVMNKRSWRPATKIKWETYIKKIQIEARVFGDLSLNHIIPMATKYQSMLVDNVNKLETDIPC